jgi:hypothetical protein
VIVSPRFLLSAAHCARGYDGKRAPGAFHLDLGGRRHELHLVETGDFAPDDGKMGDWMVFEALDLPGDTAFASLATPAELQDLGRVTDALADRSVPIWTITFPSRGVRTYPRPALSGSGVFLSPGYVKSDRAYREATLLTLVEGVVYDDLISATAPRFHGDVDAEWPRRAFQGLQNLHQKYASDGHAVVYHSADYAPGSSGGGVFLEHSGHLLGIIPMGNTPLQRKDAYPGFGQLYRIDAVCRASRVLGTLPDCRAFASADGGT